MNGDERTELGALRAEVRALTLTVASLAAKFEGLEKRGEDHEQRLRKVEAWRQALPVSTLIFLGTTAIALVALFLRS
jgi:hypothetical protein